jgi:hypothetical protein
MVAHRMEEVLEQSRKIPEFLRGLKTMDLEAINFRGKNTVKRQIQIMNMSSIWASKSGFNDSNCEFPSFHPVVSTVQLFT